jgi:hypothetical protein
MTGVIASFTIVNQRFDKRHLRGYQRRWATPRNVGKSYNGGKVNLAETKQAVENKRCMETGTGGASLSAFNTHKCYGRVGRLSGLAPTRPGMFSLKS